MNRRDFLKNTGRALVAVGVSGLASSVIARESPKMRSAQDYVAAKFKSYAIDGTFRYYLWKDKITTTQKVEMSGDLLPGFEQKDWFIRSIGKSPPIGEKPDPEESILPEYDTHVLDVGIYLGRNFLGLCYSTLNSSGAKINEVFSEDSGTEAYVAFHNKVRLSNIIQTAYVKFPENEKGFFGVPENSDRGILTSANESIFNGGLTLDNVKQLDNLFDKESEIKPVRLNTLPNQLGPQYNFYKVPLLPVEPNVKGAIVGRASLFVIDTPPEANDFPSALVWFPKLSVTGGRAKRTVSLEKLIYEVASRKAINEELQNQKEEEQKKIKRMSDVVF